MSLSPSWCPRAILMGAVLALCSPVCLYAQKAAVPAVAVSAPRPVAVAGNIQQAMCIRCDSPNYPISARQAHVTGNVELHALIGANGQVQKLSVIRGNQLLRQTALQAAYGWRYHPLLLNGKPIPVDTTILVRFEPSN